MKCWVFVPNKIAKNTLQVKELGYNLGTQQMCTFVQIDI
jgi:hypothetical protein